MSDAMKLSKKTVAALALTSLALTNCSKATEPEKTREQKAESCRGFVNFKRIPTVTVAQIADGNEGVYKLTDIKVYVESTQDGKVSYFAGLTSIPANADPTPAATPTPAPTPAPSATPADAQKPADPAAPAEPSKPAEVQQISAASKILCSDMTDLPEGEMHAEAEAPLAISRKDGKIPEKLRYKLKANFQQHGEKSEAVEKSSTKAATEVEAQEATVLQTELGNGANRTFYRAGSGFVVRTEQTDGSSKMITVLMYRLTQPKQ
jgi:hypothetical protein